jgi:hypothetical protein
MENLRQDVHKAPEQLEREADSARNAVEGTLAELEQRLSPGQMLDRVMDMVKRHGGEFGENLLVQVRNNPMPTIMAGVGMAWLMGASKRPPPREPSRPYRGNGSWRSSGSSERPASDTWSSEWNDSAFGSAGDAASSAARSARDAASSTARTASDAMHSAGDAASDAVHSAGDAVRGAADATRDAAYRAADATRGAAQRAASATRDTFDTMAEASRAGARGVTEGYSYLFREQPLVLGAIAIAVGAALGAMLPSTPTEDRLIGETSDEAKARVKSEAKSRADDLSNAASRAMDKMEDAAASAADTMADELSASDEMSASDDEMAADDSRDATSRDGGISRDGAGRRARITPSDESMDNPALRTGPGQVDGSV